MLENVLNISSDILHDLILRFKEFQAKEGGDSEEQIPDSEYESDMSQILEDNADDMTSVEIRKTIEDLEPDQKVDLLAMMYLGRGDFELDDWSHARKEAKDNLAPNLAGYLMGKPQIAEYLEKAMEALGYTTE